MIGQTQHLGNQSHFLISSSLFYFKEAHLVCLFLAVVTDFESGSNHCRTQGTHTQSAAHAFNVFLLWLGFCGLPVEPEEEAVSGCAPLQHSCTGTKGLKRSCFLLGTMSTLSAAVVLETGASSPWCPLCLRRSFALRRSGQGCLWFPGRRITPTCYISVL